MNLNEIAIFVKIVETGSFVAAAKALDMPKSTVSARLSSLEKRLGVTLIRRTTRKLHVTDAGSSYYQECLKAIDQIMAAEEEVLQSQSDPHGSLRITAPVELGGKILPPVVAEFNRRYPKVILDIHLTDETVDLLADGMDIGIRVGDLKDSTMIAKNLGSVYFALFASSKYLKTKGAPETPKDLAHHSCLQFSALSSDEWSLVALKNKQTVKLSKPMIINDLNLIKSLTMLGVGIAMLPTFYCVDEIGSGKLVRVLTNWRSQVRPVHFVYPAQRFVSPKIKAFIEVASTIIKKNLERSEF